jgi:hypothetical protein
MVTTQTKTLLNAVTATTTSASFPIGPFGKTSIQFTCANHTAGNGVFTVDVSNDGVSWVAYNKLTTNVTNTNAQTDTRVASVTLSSNTSSVVSIPESFAFIRATVTVTTDGTYSATIFTS